MRKPRYEVLTYDIDTGEFTPQQALRRAPWSKWGLRRALRRLRTMGYDGTRQDNSILVQLHKENP